ncbi:hypothetical protein ACNOYE_10820 [Nannocystaceae bacterium ST9]
MKSRVVVLATLGLLACPRRPPDCEYDSIERCLWERGRETPDPSGEGSPGESGVGNEGEPQLDGDDEPYERWAELDAALDELAELIGSGLEWPLVDERARELCGSPPELRDAPDEPPAWACPLADVLELDGNALVLEVGEGVVSLTAESLTERVSEKLVALALDTAGDSCIDGFDAVEGPVNQEFSSCTLRSGPLLYVGRFPQDLDADRWQVSIAVVDAG